MNATMTEPPRPIQPMQDIPGLTRLWELQMKLNEQYQNRISELERRVAELEKR